MKPKDSIYKLACKQYGDSLTRKTFNKYIYESGVIMPNRKRNFTPEEVNTIMELFGIETLEAS